MDMILYNLQKEREAIKKHNSWIDTCVDCGIKSNGVYVCEHCGQRYCGKCLKDHKC